MSKKKLLIHSCCGPCSSAVLERLHDEYDVTVFYYNPNIAPPEEYARRLDTQREIIAKLPFGGEIGLIEGPYEPDVFLSAVKGLESEPEGGRRCAVCFDLRLLRTAQCAAERGFELFTTTLTISPHKNAPLINEIGERIAAGCGVPWLYSDFKKKDGYLRSIRLSEEYGLYRQNYCGCAFSIR